MKFKSLSNHQNLIKTAHWKKVGPAIPPIGTHEQKGILSHFGGAV